MHILLVIHSEGRLTRYRLTSFPASGFGGLPTCGRGRDAVAGVVGKRSFGKLPESDAGRGATRGFPTFGERIAPS
ncbi:MAG: hypothetical protein QOH21_1792 [Acidobacteriota bacterium]|jgi:hypothetical protein|nr:hypothetical protein [Acidobacteriota bacterium]